MPELQYW